MKLSQWAMSGYFSGMQNLSELESALKPLAVEEKWDVAQWLLQDLHEASRSLTEENGAPEATKGEAPDYAERRRKIFGDQVIPNMGAGGSD